MPNRQLVLLAAIVLAFVAFVVSAVTDPYWSARDVVGLVLFAVFFVGLVVVMLIRRGNEPVEGHRGLPRNYWVVFASFAAAFALLMAVAVLCLPFFGIRAFDALLGPERWWLYLLTAAVLFPFVRKRLL
jgi:hypothetical protein